MPLWHRLSNSDSRATARLPLLHSEHPQKRINRRVVSDRKEGEVRKAAFEWAQYWQVPLYEGFRRHPLTAGFTFSASCRNGEARRSVDPTQ